MNLHRKLQAVLLANIGTRIYLEESEADILCLNHHLVQPTKKCCGDVFVYGFFDWNERPMRLARDTKDRWFVDTF